MALALPRADDLRLIRAICHFVAQTRRKYVLHSDVDHWLRVTALRLYGHGWKRSRIYHYTSAARELHLIRTKDLHHIELTPKGRAMVRCNPQARQDSPLSEAEKQLFRELLPTYSAVMQYLSLYMPDGRYPKSVSEFVHSGRPIKLTRDKHTKLYVLSSSSNRHRLVNRSQKMSFAWTLFNWLRSLELVDDVYEEHEASFLIQDSETRVFYPIRQRSLSVSRLKSLLLNEARKIPRDVVYFYLPDLLANLCAWHGIPKRLFVNTLLKLNRIDPIHYHLEMMSSVRSDVRCKEHYDYENFPEVGGVFRSHVCIRK